MSKLTYTDALELAIGNITNHGIPADAHHVGEEDVITQEEVVEKLRSLWSQLVKRNSAKSGKPTKTQVANERIKATIISTLGEIGKPATVTEVQDANPELAVLSNQKVSALLSQLVADGQAVKTVDKRKSYFSLPDPIDEETV